MTFYILLGLVLSLWLFSFTAAVFGLRWILIVERRRIGAALIASSLAVASAYPGLSRFHIDASRTVNGHLQWSFHSHWFFVVSMLMGIVSLALALWNLKKADRLGSPLS